MGHHPRMHVIGEREESRDHVFFACPTTLTIWAALTVRLLGSAASPDWSTTVRHLKRRNRSKMDSILLLLAFHATIYFVWKERNVRRHQGSWMSTDRMTRQIDKAIRNRISSLKLRVSSAVGLKFIVDEVILWR